MAFRADEAAQDGYERARRILVLSPGVEADKREKADAALQDLTDGWRDALGRAEPDVIVWETERPLTDELREPAWYDAGRFGEFTVFCRSSIADRCR